MANYVKNFVTGHGINFEISKRNVEAFEKATRKWAEIYVNLNITPNSVIMLCGAKNNGKSSLLRYLINTFNREGLSKTQHIDDIPIIDDEDQGESVACANNRFAYLIDYDPGQSEMTTPGIISAHVIRANAQPLRSPTYMNINQHEEIVQASVGGTNMSVNPKMYIENSRAIYKKVCEHRKSQVVKQPIFVNTMGHIRNIGLAMLMDLIKICRPTNLIVLNVENDSMRTIYADLTPQALNSAQASFYYETSQQTKALKYNLDMQNLDFSFVDSSSIASRNRTALQLAYIASIPEALYKPIMQLSPKWVSLQTNLIYCVSSYPLKEAIVLELLYHSWVHLVKLARPISFGNEEDSHPERICNIVDEIGENILKGCGIVADIDLENKRLAIITPTSQSVIDEDVNCVVKPLSIQVPREMMPESG